MSYPLEDVKVLDLTRLLPGPFCTMMLADYGADVLRVEDTGAGDYLRFWPPYYGDDADNASGTRSAAYLALNRGKRAIRLDLKKEEGKDLLMRLVDSHDILVESFRPGVMDRLGLGYETLRERNPALIYCAISGYGQDGDNRDRAGHDMNYLGLAGMLGLTGRKGGPPVQAAGQIADLGGGALMALFGIMAAIHERSRSGEGQFLDVSMTDGALSWLSILAAAYFCDDDVPRRGDPDLSGGRVCYFVYETSDGRWMSLGALEPKFWREWCVGVDREDLIDRQLEPPDSEAGRQVADSRGDRKKRKTPSAIEDPKRWDMILVGEKGMMLFKRSSTDWMVTPGRRLEQFADVPKTIRRVSNEDVEWVEACKGGPKPLSSFDYAGPFTEMVLLGNLAVRLGKEIEWDAEALKATHDPEDDELIRRQYRKGWDLPVPTAVSRVG